MAKITVTSGVFGTKGTTCPATLYKMVDISRSVDFGVTPVADNSNYALIAIPKGFLVSHIAVEQTKVTAADTALTFKCDEDATPIQLGGTFTLDSTKADMIRQCDAAITSSGYVASTSAGSPTVALDAPSCKYFKDARTLCVCVPDGLTGETLAAGAMTVHVIGYQVFGDSLSDVKAGTPAYAEGQSDADAAGNKSGGDPMFRAPEYIKG